MAKLENFIEKYLKNKKATDYEGWLALYGEDATPRYREDVADADTAYEKARAEHGKRASALYQNGLSGSGYSDYLNHTAYAARAESLSRAKERRAQTEADNQKGYVSYLADLKAEEDKETAEAEKKEQSIFSSLLSKRLTDKNAAITFLTANGVDPTRAEELAEQSLDILHGSKSYRDHITSKVNYLDLDYSAAYKYAIMMGASEETARIIAEIAAYNREYNYGNNYHYY